MRIVKVLLIIICVSSSNYLFGQEAEIFDKINEIGMKYISSLKSGKIEHMKNITPPKDTWTFEKLLVYKKRMSKPEGIEYGSFIMPSLSENKYGFNFFAIDIHETDEPYLFVAIVSINIKENDPIVENAFLFTEKISLTDWWMRAVSFYKDIKESKVKVNIPDKYIYPICPPPPFKYN